MILVDQTTKEIADKLIDMTKSGIVEVYTKVQQLAPDLWKLVIRQTIINGVECFIGALFMVPFIAYGIWAIRHAFKPDVYDDEVYAITGVIALIAGVILLPTFLINGLDLALNPSYWALRDILDMVRGH